MQAEEAALLSKCAELGAELEKVTADSAAAEKLLRGDTQRASNEALSARTEAVRAKVRLPEGDRLNCFYGVQGFRSTPCATACPPGFTLSAVASCYLWLLTVCRWGSNGVVAGTQSTWTQ